MYDTPVSLQDVCMEFICKNLGTLCQAEPKYCFRDKEAMFHGQLSEQLLTTLSERGQLNDKTLALFDPSVTQLRHVIIHNAQLTTAGLQVLKSHRILELELTWLKSTTVNSVICAGMGEWTQSNLRALDVSHCTFNSNSNFCVFVSLSKLRSLRSLNVSFTEFNGQGLEIIVEDLPLLENLDISGTHITDISPLRKCRQRLKFLSMYNVQVAKSQETVAVLVELTNLLHLDLSSDSSMQPFHPVNQHKFYIADFLARPQALPNLRYLDISGRDGIMEDALLDYLQYHPHLQFLGLAVTQACQCSAFAEESSPYKDLRITGEATEKQLMESVRHYATRPIYVQKSLYSLFSFTQGMDNPREDIIKLVLPAMQNHPKQLGVQMAATACLYNLSKGEIGPRVHPALLRQIVELTLLAMENFPNHQQLQKNALLTLCSDRILQDVSFDRYRCAKNVMECLCLFDDASMNRMSVAICSILAAKVTTLETTRLGAKGAYMKKLLLLVKQRLESVQIDITLKFTLSALWNLTDESPATCGVFLKESGLELFMNMLQVLHQHTEVDENSRVQIETKILGLLNNIAEVKSLHSNLMREDFIMLVNRLVMADAIDVSYFAAGIIAHLTYEGEKSWLIATTSREDTLQQLFTTILKWEQPETEMVAYRSFSPFFPLLVSNVPAVQLWAVWAIHHVCSKNGKRYCTLLKEEEGVRIIKDLAANPNTEKHVQEMAQKISDILEKTQSPAVAAS